MKRRDSRFIGIQQEKLGFTSLSVLLSLYGLFFAVVVFLVEANHLPNQVGFVGLLGFVLFQFLFGPHIMDSHLKLLGSLRWVTYKELPEFLASFIQEICRKEMIPLPQIGFYKRTHFKHTSWDEPLSNYVEVRKLEKRCSTIEQLWFDPPSRGMAEILPIASFTSKEQIM